MVPAKDHFHLGEEIQDKFRKVDLELRHRQQLHL